MTSTLPPDTHPAELSSTLAPLRAGERIRLLHERLGSRLVATTSFGIQAAVMLHLIHEHAPEIPVVFIDTGFLFPETYRYAEELMGRFNLDFRIYQPMVSAARMQALWGNLWEQTKEDADRMLAAAPGLYLLLDTGHLTCAGSDALETLWAHKDRIGHVHLKDFWADDPATWTWPGSKFGEEGRFKELGDGNMGLDIPGILKALEEINYEGWVAVELDRATIPMELAAKKNREYLKGLGY